MAGHNPKIAYPVMEGYVSVFKPSSPWLLFKRDEYDAVAAKIDRMSLPLRELMDKVIRHDALDPVTRRATAHPLEKLDAAAKTAFDAEMNRLGIGDFGDMKSVYLDKRQGGNGYRTPVYKVNGHPVMGIHFNDDGSLKPVQKSVYAPAAKPQQPKR